MTQFQNIAIQYCILSHLIESKQIFSSICRQNFTHKLSQLKNFPKTDFRTRLVLIKYSIAYQYHVKISEVGISSKLIFLKKKKLNPLTL